MLVALVSSIVLSTNSCAPNLSYCIKVCNTNNIPTAQNEEEGVGHYIEKNQGRKGDMIIAVKLLARYEGR